MDEPERPEPGRNLAHPAGGRDPADRHPVGDELLLDKRVLDIAHARFENATVGDIQDTFIKEKLVADRVPIGKIAPVGWVGEVAAAARTVPARP